MKRGDIDIETQFIDMGLDSIVGIEWVQVINKQYDFSLPATKIYDYSNIRELTGFLIKELEKRGENKKPLQQTVFNSVDQHKFSNSHSLRTMADVIHLEEHSMMIVLLE